MPRFQSACYIRGGITPTISRIPESVITTRRLLRGLADRFGTRRAKGEKIAASSTKNVQRPISCGSGHEDPWGLEYERHPLEADEAAHPEHLAAGLAVALNERAAKPTRSRAWRLDFGDSAGSFALAFDGERWSLAGGDLPADVVVSTTPRAWAEFVTTPPASR